MREIKREIERIRENIDYLPKTLYHIKDNIERSLHEIDNILEDNSKKANIMNNEIEKRWEYCIIGILGIFIILANIFAPIYTGFNIIIFLILCFSFLPMIINSIILIVLGIKKDRELNPIEKIKQSPREFFGLIYCIAGLLITGAITMISISHTHYASMNSDRMLLEIELYHVPLFIISFIQFFVILMIIKE